MFRIQREWHYSLGRNCEVQVCSSNLVEWKPENKLFIKREELDLWSPALRKPIDIWRSEIIHLDVLQSTALPDENSRLSKSPICFWFSVGKLRVSCSEIYSNVHIWDVRFQIVERSWGSNKLKCNDPQLWRYIFLEDSLLLGIIQEPKSSWMLVHFTTVTPWKEKWWWSHQLSNITYVLLPLKNVPHLCLNASICFKLPSDELCSSSLIGHYHNDRAVIAWLPVALYAAVWAANESASLIQGPCFYQKF